MSADPKRRQFLVYLACLVMLILLGWLDYLTGYELGFFVFYSVPVGIAAWYLGRWPAELETVRDTLRARAGAPACPSGVPPNPLTRSPAVSGMADAPATR